MLEEMKKIEMNLNGKKQTFVLEIKSTRNSTWQGTILWIETQQKIAFRSALEAIKILDSAMESQKSDEGETELFAAV